MSSDPAEGKAKINWYLILNLRSFVGIRGNLRSFRAFLRSIFSHIFQQICEKVPQ